MLQFEISRTEKKFNKTKKKGISHRLWTLGTVKTLTLY